MQQLLLLLVWRVTPSSAHGLPTTVLGVMEVPQRCPSTLRSLDPGWRSLRSLAAHRRTGLTPNAVDTQRQALMRKQQKLRWIFAFVVNTVGKPLVRGARMSSYRTHQVSRIMHAEHQPLALCTRARKLWYSQVECARLALAVIQEDQRLIKGAWLLSIPD
jgi:hypothetical protein